MDPASEIFHKMCNTLNEMEVSIIGKDRNDGKTRKKA
jgi:hypothetical protein